ncbi:DUF6538 domain-containing protein [Nitratireductor sp.]|uniref:DUF6538 domain-containing protein n=1 Tax=Nitratireductor sp. TaxID=1872084 RepID=UPI002602357C|nr:DUF6538 domain-containing protein [Nitratireductor sp.]MCV0380543.1 tyrosine-type recombinase/integrase [Nitratireductor sp.]
MANSQQYLEWHGQQWRVVVFIPRKLQNTLGRTRFKQALGTSDLKEANERKWAVVTRMKAAIAQARRAASSNDPREAEALLARLHAADEGTQYWLHDRAGKIAATEGREAATAFFNLASGKTTPLDHHTDAFLSFKAGYRLKSQGDFKRVLRWLGDWLKAEHHTATLEAVTRKTAGQFIEHSLCAGRSRDKAAAYLGFLREYWKWLQKRGHADDNPWSGQELPEQSRRDRSAERDGGKRPYTDEEAAALLYGPVSDLMRPPPSLYLTDLMHIAALSGMRLEEICQLRVADCKGGTFTIHEGKTDNARRTVPIHPDLTGIISRRTKNNPDDAYLVDGLPDIPTSRDSRSDPASKAFSRYRRKMKVDERPNDKAKSNVDFHSFRRWFIRKARDAMQEPNAGFSAWTIADVVGHDDEGVKNLFKLTMSHYPGASSDKAKRALVKAVKLPT